jgi:hypothetical protein
VSRGKVSRLMALVGLAAIYQRPRTTTPNPAHKIYPYLLKNFVIDRPNQVWCADITYLPMRRGFLYLVAIMDWHSRKVLAWRLSNSMHADFCVEALREAMERHGKPEIFNTDQGSQGEFKWSSQHSGEECWDGRSASIRSCVAEQVAVAGATSGRAADAPSAFLGIDRGWPIERGRGGWCGRVGAGRREMVSGGRRHATIDACAIIEAVVRPIPVVYRAGGACNPDG